MLMVPKSARAHSIKSRVVPKSAVARERVNTLFPLVSGLGSRLYLGREFKLLYEAGASFASMLVTPLAT